MKIPYFITENLLGQWMIEQHFAFAFLEKIIESPLMSIFDIKERGEFKFSIADAFSINAASGLDKVKNTFDQAPKGSVAIIPINGVIMKYGTDYNFGSVEIADVIAQAAISSNIAAILLQIDSGGGAVNAINPMLEAISFARMKKPVVSIADRAASAAYYIASSTDHIMAENNISSSFGSIGVMTSFSTIDPFLKKHGIEKRDIYAPESEHKNDAYEASRKGDDSVVQSDILSPLAVKFQNHVKQMRSGKLNESVTGLLSGKMFYAEDALKHGLIDSIGSMQKAIDKALIMADIKKFMKT